MSSFICERCQKHIIDSGGYITGCQHYPMEPDMTMCTSETCGKRKSCWRHEAEPNDYQQSYDDFSRSCENKDASDCKYLLEILGRGRE